MVMHAARNAVSEAGVKYKRQRVQRMKANSLSSVDHLYAVCSIEKGKR